MRKIRVFEHTSLDGVMDQDEDYAYSGWTMPFRSPAGLQILVETHGAHFDLLLGRRTYDTWAEFWPKSGTGPFAAGINAATKYVATHRPESLGWGPCKDLGADVPAGVRALKSADGLDLLVWGSSTLTPMLFQNGLVDELTLIVYPVLLGRGKRYFSEPVEGRSLALASSKATPTGVLINTYRSVGPLKP